MLCFFVLNEFQKKLMSLNDYKKNQVTIQFLHEIFSEVVKQCQQIEQLVGNSYSYESRNEGNLGRMISFYLVKEKHHCHHHQESLTEDSFNIFLTILSFITISLY